MKVLHTIHSVDPRSGGPSHAIRALVQAQRAAGLKVSLLTTTTQSAEPWQRRHRYQAEMMRDPAFAQIELVMARAYGRRAPFRRFGLSPQATRWLERRFANDEARPDVVHIHGVFSHLSSAAAAAARRSGVPYIVRPAGSLDLGCLSHGSRQLKRLFLRVYLDKDLRHAARLHAMSAREADELAAFGSPASIIDVPHGVELPMVDHAAAKRALIERFPQLAERRVLLVLARVHAIKRPEWVVEALAALQHSHPDLMLVVAGNDAGHLPALEAEIAQRRVEARVVMAGFLQGSLKTTALAAADVFVLPSRHENFGVATVEALAHGTPAVVTPGVAAHTYIDRSGAGRTVQESPKALAEGIAAVLADDPQTLGQRGRQFVEQHLAWPAVVRRLKDVYAAVQPGPAPQDVELLQPHTAA